MAKIVVTRRVLLDRWRRIEEQEDIDDGDSAPLLPSSSTSRNRQPLHILKEQWFADAFNFLICLPEESHIWCTFWDIMGPLLETFYNYFKDERKDSPLRSLWKRISSEMQHCIQCISQHYHAQDMYHMEYETSSIGPLLDVLRRLDVERVYSHLKHINSKIAKENHGYANDNTEVVSLLYEVLMYPALLTDHTLFMEFELFVEAVDKNHELALDGHQQFPGVYALFFLKRSVRSIGYRLASSMGKFRRATDLERLQPLLEKFIGLLETEALPSVLENSIPRAQMDRVSLWIGIKSLLGFLEPPAFEEGILERYPIFLDIVLNHISGDSLEFSHAVTCLKLLFEMLGCKLWLRSTLSPIVMHNTLLGQCFHSRNEKTHKDIFDLFQPFLQSLEALQDGEHAKQRRHFLYFLLHQVPVSGNFSILTRKLACQVALLIVHRGYKMIPPSPPFECAHMWGPSLLSSLKDYSLHTSLRQPAFDLIQTIIVSDTTALVSSVLNQYPSLSIDSSMLIKVDDDEDDDRLTFLSDSEEKDGCAWTEFGFQSKITFSECREWMCIPMLWVDVLVEVDLSVLPVSFSKAVFWARSRFPFMEPEDSAEMAIPIRNWMSSRAADITHSFGWKVPTGYDDGGEGNPSTNSVDIWTMSLPLLRTFKRLTTHFLVQMRQGVPQKQWTWEPPMGESLILSLIDPNDSIRQFGKSILEQVSDTRGLTCGLKFLCSFQCALSAIFLGLRHAMKLVQLDSVLSKFQTLHHFLFVLFKLLKQGDSLTPELLENTPSGSTVTNLSSQGGFLRQTTLDSSPMEIVQLSSHTDLKSQEMFIYLLCETTWPFACRCLVEGKKYIDYSFCQMTCVRLLEILPIICEKLGSSPVKDLECFRIDIFSDLSWLHDLVHWGRSYLKVVMVYWKRAVTSLLNLLKRFCNEASALIIARIENLVMSESPSMEELTSQVSDLSVSLSCECSSSVKTDRNSKSLLFQSLSFNKKVIGSDVGPSSLKSPDMQMDMSAIMRNLNTSNVIVLSDDETEPKTPSTKVTHADAKTSQSPMFDKESSFGVGEKTSNILNGQNIVSLANTSKDFLEPFSDIDARDSCGTHSEKRVTNNGRDKAVSIVYSKANSGKTSNVKLTSKVSDNITSDKFPVKAGSSKILSQAGENLAPQNRHSRLNEMFQDAEDSALDAALDSVVGNQSLIVKPPTVSKRKIIQLKTPVGNRSSHYSRLESSMKRFKAPKLDDWYKSILQINYYVTVGLSTGKEDNNQRLTSSKLKEIPVHFQSPEHYMKIFQPLVLEEFKAQLESSFLEMSSILEMFFGILSVIAVERVDDFHLVRFVHDRSDAIESRSFSENDLVLVTKDHPEKSLQDVHIVGKVERRERDCKRNLSIMVVRFYLQNGFPRMNQARRNLIERSKWHVCRIMSITPQLREFQALSSINTIPILPVILDPSRDSLHHNKSREDNLSKLSQPLQQTLMSSFNDSQLHAISRAIVDRKDFELSLIQGPPGTGKTRTIVAIISCLLAFSSQRIDGAKHSSIYCKRPNTSNRKSHLSESAAIARAWQDAALARQMHEDVQSTARISENLTRRRLLICAQSNAAVDELVARISSQGLYCSNGKMYKPYLVRVGNAKTVHQNSLPFFIDTIVDQRVAEALHLSKGKNSPGGDSSANLRSALEKLVDRIRFFEIKRANLRDGNLIVRTLSDCDFPKSNEDNEMSDSEIESQLKKLYDQKRRIYTDLITAQAQERKANEEIKWLRHKLRKSILREAEVVVTTLSGCGGDLYGVCSESTASFKFGSPNEHTLFDAVLIDEAAQAHEPATLIPLQLLKSCGTKCIMVGDPKQLPATVLSNMASKFLYQCSMFERLQRAGHSVTMLTEQYRMHPEISKFPSLHFYDNKLLNGCNISSKSAPFHKTKGLGPYVFYDVVDGRELRGKDSGAFSLYNGHEADAAVEVLRFFKKRYPTEFVGGRIGMITPYKCQLSLLRSRISSVFGSSLTAEMEFNTVDSFQGREVDILLLSTVRASHSKSVETGFNSSGIGFVADGRRMNVALTRAKLSLWIFGNAKTLQTNHNWSALLKDAKTRNLVLSATKPYKSIFKTGFQRGCLSEGCDDQLGAVKPVDKLNDASHHAINERGTFGRMKKLLAAESPSSEEVPTGHKSTLASEGKSARNHKRNLNHLVLSKTDHSLLSASRDEKNSSVRESTISHEHEAEGEWKAKEGRILSSTTSSGKKNFKSEHSGKNLQRSEQPTDAKPKRIKQLISETPNRSSKGSSSREGVSTFSKEENCKKLQTDVAEDAIARRKRQRETVDSILCSSLLPSKKSDISCKAYSKRPSSTERGSMKPPEKRNG